VDNIHFTLPDFNKYDLEAVAVNDYTVEGTYFENMPSLASIGSNPQVFSDDPSNRVRIQLGRFRTLLEHSAKSQYTNDLHNSGLRFRLRDKATGRVSALSPVGLVVKNDKRRIFGRVLPKVFV